MGSIRSKLLPATIGTAAIGAVAFLAACSAGGGATGTTAASASPAPTSTAAPAASATAPAGGNSMMVMTFKFQPTSLRVARGTTVTWMNHDAILHTATSGTPGQKSGVFDERLDGAGSHAEHQFNEAGTFPLFCDIHQFMTGEVIVQ